MGCDPVVRGAVRAHALENYNKGGWDILVECWSDGEIAQNIGTAKTTTGAIRNVSRAVGNIDSYRSDIQGA